VAYFAASTDDPEKNRKYAESMDLDFPILSDPGCEIARAFGVFSEEHGVARRWTYYIAADGTVLYIDRAVKTATAGPDVAARLDELGVPKRSRSRSGSRRTASRRTARK